MRLLLVITLFAGLLCSCSKPKTAELNKFSDTLLIKIWEFKDQRLSDSLYPFLTNPEVKYRKDAVLAFASVQDSIAVDRIGNLLLTDGSIPVRIAAAFALGQTPCNQSRLILSEAFNKEKEKIVLCEIIESYGKVTKQWKLDIPGGDSTLTSALSWSYYRAGLNGATDTSINTASAKFLSPVLSESTRLGAAHYFGRAAKDFEKYQRVIISSAQQDSSPSVRMASTLALRKIKTDSSLAAAIRILQSDKDYRVRVNAVRVIQQFPFPQTMKHLLDALSDADVNVGIAASEAIKSSVTKESWRSIVPIARTAKNWRIEANLYEAALAASDHKELAEEIMSRLKETTDPYHKAALLTALQRSISSYGFVRDQLLNSDTPVIKSAAATALVAMNSLPTFKAAFKNKFAEIYREGIDNGDPGVIGILSNALADSTLSYRNEIKDFSFLYHAKKKLSLPKDIEALQPLEAAIAYFEGKIPTATLKNEFNHPIDWHLTKSIKREQKAIITTTKGDIKICLFVEEAPGSVSNFITLVNQQYYNNKFFHRVVPNFVVQAGCNRGDGFGSEAYSIRSEFSPRKYKKGSLGMASAGKDTEGTQWFITHSPTPHLDGRYTIFAEVYTGMDVVDRIEVGDKIIKIELIK